MTEEPALFNRHPFTIAFLLGWPMLITAGILQWVNPSSAGVLQDGLSTPILALEFMHSREELQAFFEVASPNDLRNDLLIGNAIDYIFMFLYSLFLGFTGLGIIRETGLKVIWLTVVLSVLIFFADLLENVTIASILVTYFDGGQLSDGYFGNLSFFTWLKWGGIACSLLIFGGYFWTKNLFGKVIAFVGLAALVFAGIAFYRRSYVNELMGLAVVLSFLLLMIHHGLFAIRKPVKA